MKLELQLIKWYIVDLILLYIYKYTHTHTHTHTSFQIFVVWALLLIVYTSNSRPIRSNLLRLQCTCCKGVIKSLRVDFLSGLLGSGRASMLPLGTLSLSLWVIAVDPAFIAGQQSIKNCGIRIDQLDHLPTVRTTSFFLIFSEHPWDKLRANLSHLQFLANNCMYSSHTDIKLCTYCLYRHTTVLIHEILYLAYQLWCSDFLTPPTPLIIPHRLPAFLESLMPTKTDARFMQDGRKAVWSIPYVFVAFFPSLKQNFIAYRSFKVSWRPDCIFEIQQLWQSGFSRVYSNCCCSCSFEAEIIKIFSVIS